MGKSKGKSGKASAVRIGKVVAWDEKKGFGWLECEGEKIFVHVMEFRGCKQQPGLGVEFPFVMGTDVRGRPCAKGIHTPLVIGRMKISGILLLLALLFWPVMGLIQLPVVWWWPVLQVTVLSAVTFRLYAYDKRQAIVKGWRVPETILHLGEIAGGWPGGFIAQRILRHKSTKKGYQTIFWGIILIHQVIGADLFFDNRFSKEIWEVMGEAGKQ
ncbi:MAG: DUF1294 domain-containing protein [Akkermansiaceae bacterium]